MEFIFKKPIEIDGETVEKINYNFKTLKGIDILDMTNELRINKHIISGAYELDPVVCSAVFAKASGIDINDISLFKAGDYLKASNLGREFFASTYKDIDLDSNVLNLSELIKVDNDNKNAITFDFDNLTGQDIISTVDEVRKMKHLVTGAYEGDPVVCASLFARAAGISIKQINELSAIDYLRASNLGRLFFMRSLDGGQASET